MKSLGIWFALLLAPYLDGAAAAGCEPVGSLDLLCGAAQPEDLARIPDTHWVLVSGFSPGGGLKLLDTRERQLRRWSGIRPGEVAFDAARYPQCPGAPDGALLNLQGLHLRASRDGSHMLLASNHGGREAIEVFTVRLEGDGSPLVTWVGCLPLPADMPANAVTSFPDGTVLATVLVTPGHSMADYVRGHDTGAVLEWPPGATSFRRVAGTELPGNNGIEADPDNIHFYVVAFGRHAIVGFERGKRARKVFEAVAPAFMPDNIHWDGRELIAAGMQHDEPACGGLRKVIDGVAERMDCHRGYTVSLLDPTSLRWRVVAYDVPNPGFNGASTGLRIGKTLWLGSYQSDRLASRPLP
ncbi:MAG: hypothetical protein RLZZ200_3134 [Pseudomonadota bacterium]|jgi:hypothetical protein